MTVLSHIFYLWRFKTVKLPWIDHNASRYAQIQDDVATVEKLNYHSDTHGTKHLISVQIKQIFSVTMPLTFQNTYSRKKYEISFSL